MVLNWNCLIKYLTCILDYAVIKGKESEPFIKAAMRSKISALVSFQKKKVSTVEQ